nr:unnamed protein product [Digitaria exilis]
MGKRDFARPHHVAFFDAMATELPDEYSTQEVNHLTLGYFAVGGLSLLRELDRFIPKHMMLRIRAMI